MVRAIAFLVNVVSTGFLIRAVFALAETPPDMKTLATFMVVGISGVVLGVVMEGVSRLEDATSTSTIIYFGFRNKAEASRIAEMLREYAQIKSITEADGDDNHEVIEAREIASRIELQITHDAGRAV